MTVSSSPSTSFCHTELYRALKEQAFGIKSFSMLSSSLEQATASVVLLEGSKIVVELTTGGYSVRSGRSFYFSVGSICRFVSRSKTLEDAMKHSMIYCKHAALCMLKSGRRS